MNTLFLYLSILVSLTFGSPDKTITGLVVDSLDSPIPGATVSIKNTAIATLTDADGKFSITFPATIENPILIVQFIGLESQEIVIGELEYVRIVMEDSKEVLDSVVVTAIGVTIDEKKIGYASETADGDSEEEHSEAFFGTRSLGDKSETKDRRTSKGTGRALSGSRSGLPVYDDASGLDKESSKKEKPKDIPVSSESTAGDDAKAGLLTAGEVNDFMKWKLWKDIDSSNLQSFISTWRMKPQHRYCVQVTNNNQQGLTDASVYLLSNFGDTLWAAKTDNTGKAELWVNMTNYEEKALPEFELRVEYQGKTAFVHNPREFQKGINFVSMETACGFQENVDIAFVVDATGSMGDEIFYLKAEMSDIIERLEKKYTDINLLTASVFYRDHTDSYLTQPSAFTEDASKTIEFIKAQSAGGGGDFPEAVDAGLEEAIDRLEWRPEARSRILFLVLDAPPHNDEASVAKMQKLARKAASKGIRIVPITGSGTDKSTEYLMRSLALATNGTYVFLTDDSGVGGGHIKPTTDKFDVESMNKLLIRLLDQYLYLPECVTADEPDNKENEKREDEYTLNDAFGPEVTEAKFSIFPNPTAGPITIKGLKDLEEIFVTDMTGKILKRIPTNDESKIETDLGEFPTGIYFVSHGEGKARVAEKIILRK